MGEMGQGYGSEWHLLHYLERNRAALSTAVGEAIGCDAVEWLAAPSNSGKTRKNPEWTGLDFLPTDSPARAAWSEFWPQRGNPPNWDAVGQVTTQGGTEWLLVEAKAHLGEIQSSCGAKAAGGRATIERALAETKAALGVPAERDWLSGYYQYCNRVAVLHFLTRQSVPARLLFLYFTGDRFPDGTADCPADAKGWKSALEAQAAHVGLPEGHPLSDRIHTLFLPVRAETTARPDEARNRTTGDAEFERILSNCPGHVRRLHDWLDDFCREIGAERVSASERGEGRTYYVGDRPFFRMDPKPTRGWIGIRLWGLPDELVERLGPVNPRPDKSWTTIRDAARLSDLEDLIRLSHENRRHARRH